MRRLCTPGLVLVVSVVGCASAPDPEPDIARAKTQVEEAQQAGAGAFSSLQLQSATTNLQQAQIAAERGDEKRATDLAQRAELDAQLADAMMRRQQADKAAAEISVGAAALKEEADRARQLSPPPAAPIPSTNSREGMP